MHADVIEDAKGSCTICGMDLVATRLDLAWTCTLHGVVRETAPGGCPICRRELVPITIALSFTCPSHADVERVDPGLCPIDGQPLVVKRTARPHGDHNPRHGGLFFMSPDNWHHIEGTYPEPGVFRIHLYDDYTKPLPIAGTTGRAVTDEAFNSQTRETLEKAAAPLAPSADGQTLEARVGDLRLPARIVAKIQFEPGGPEHRFDFVFPAYSQDTGGGLVPTAGVMLQPADALPERPREILAALEARHTRLAQLLDRGAYNEVYIPALEAKDLALLLQERTGDLPAARQRTFDLATRRLVQSAWLLDSYGDLGDRQRVTAAFRAFAAALADLTTIVDAR